MSGHPAGGGREPPPARPAKPNPADCCGEGCARCVWDIYEDALEDYREALAAWRARQALDADDPGHG